MIIEREGKFYLLSKDGKKKLGGPYSKRSSAQLREAQVLSLKHARSGIAQRAKGMKNERKDIG